MDEIGYQMSYSQKKSVVFDRRTGLPLLIISGSIGWASVLETINAVRAWLTPIVIYRGTAPAIPLDY
jgi:hypothetical protein